MIFNLPAIQASSKGHMGTDGKCYGYYYFFEKISPEINSRLYYQLGLGGRFGNDYYYIKPLGTKQGLYMIVEIEVYEWVDNSWVDVDWWRGHTEQIYIDEMIDILSGLGYPPGIPLTDGCTVDSCHEQRKLATAECGDDDNVLEVNLENCEFQCSPYPEQNLGPPQCE